MDLDLLVHLVRRMHLLVDLVVDFDELPFVRLRIERGVYGVRGIPNASGNQP
jgi:hypothetical protein